MESSFSDSENLLNISKWAQAQNSAPCNQRTD